MSLPPSAHREHGKGSASHKHCLLGCLSHQQVHGSDAHFGRKWPRREGQMLCEGPLGYEEALGDQGQHCLAPAGAASRSGPGTMGLLASLEASICFSKFTPCSSPSAPRLRGRSVGTVPSASFAPWQLVGFGHGGGAASGHGRVEGEGSLGIYCPCSLPSRSLWVTAAGRWPFPDLPLSGGGHWTLPRFLPIGASPALLASSNFINN